MKMLISIRRAYLCALTLAVFALPQASAAATFQGEFWDASGAVRSLARADAIIGAGDPTATFTSTAIDYPNGGTGSFNSRNSLVNFLGADAGSIVGDGSVNLRSSVFRFTGYLEIIPGVSNYGLFSDDGFRLTIDRNVVSQQNSPRGFRETSTDADLGSGIVPFELIFYENFGNTGVEFYINNALAAPSPVPLPPSAPLVLLALGALMALRRSKAGTGVQLPLANPA